MSNKKIGNKMPFAVFFMVLLNDKNVSFSDERVKRLAYPLYYSNKGDAEKYISYTKHFSAELYDSTGSGGKIYFRADADEFYEDIYNHRSEYCFSAILKLFAHFYDEKSIQTIASKDDVKECYRIMIDNRTDIPSTRFDSEYCWKIAQLFLIKYSHVESITLEESYVRRREMIRNASGTVYIEGTTLNKALSTNGEIVASSILDDLFENKRIEIINIFILNYGYLNIYQEDASSGIEQSILNIFHKVKGAKHCPHINIVLLSDFSLSFSLLTNESFLKRNTFIFTKDRKFKGQYLYFSSYEREYRVQKEYFEFLLDCSYDVDIESRKESTYAIKSQLQKGAEKSGKLRKHISLKKVHPKQMENLTRSSFLVKVDKDSNDFSRYINLDNTQRVIIPYINETEHLLESVMKEHDKNGWAKVIPAADLGFPNNVTRIAGGFMTGALYDWSCTVPIIPIDATVNTCTSSVFRLNNFDESMANERFENIVETLCKRAMDSGYAFTFRSGNHFLSVASDDDGNFYLVLHSSAKQSKESCFGLYPSDKSWFNENIKVKYNEGGTRYIRYIRGNAAVKFIDYSNRFRCFNEEIHQYMAEVFEELCNIELSSQPPIIKHHYGMPTDNSVAIGTFVVDVDSDSRNDLIVPIFSDFGKDICLYEVFNQQEHIYNPAGTNDSVILVPHGWGQVIDDIRNIKIKNACDEKKRELLLEFSGNSLSVPVNPTERLNLTQKHIRQFNSIESFLECKCSHINGKIKKKLHPLFCYCDLSVKNKRFRIGEKGNTI